MSTFTVSLRKREDVAEGTTAFHFEKPPGFSFKPGQAIDLIMPGPQTDNAQNSRHAFSIVSAPFQDELVIATRMRDSVFKRALNSLRIGDKVEIDGPFGALRLHGDAARPAVFIAGGIGITPFMSMLRQAAHDNTSRRLLLLYANRRPEDAAFLDELQGMERKRPGFRLIGVMSEMARSARPWHGPTGFIDDKLLREAGGGAQLPVYYLVGPPGMVEAMRRALGRINVGEDDIRSEEFYGY